MLHALASRAGHTALLIGSASIDAGILTRLDSAIRAQNIAPALIEGIVIIVAGPDGPGPYGRISAAAAAQLGVEEITLLVIRPDGHVGLRSDRNHAEDMTSYLRLLMSGQA
jgi:hypothetical protein